jgi:hypothetical protein
MNDSQRKKSGLSNNWAVNEVDHLFSKLARYTRFVVFSKWFLLVFAIGLMVTLITVPLVSKDRSGVRVSFVDTQTNGKGAAASPVMSNPEYRGTSEKGDQFKVGGARAIQVSPTHITIEQVEAQMITPTGSWRSLTAQRAEYDQDKKMIALMGDVTLVDEQGYSFVTDAATVNMATMEVVGDSPIQGVGPLGNLLASSFKIMDSGKRIIFAGGPERLRLRIDRKAKE